MRIIPVIALTLSLRWLHFVVFGCLLWACGDHPIRSKSSEAGPYFPMSLRSSSSGTSFDDIVKSTSLTCPTGVNCPGNVGLVVVKAKMEDGNVGHGQCTGSLVSHDVVLTNSHCIPDEVKNGSVPCEGRLAFMVLETSGAWQGTKIYSHCEKLLFDSGFKDSNKTAPDYALFRLKKSLNAKPLEVSTQGVSDMKAVNIWSVDPDSETGLSGTFRKIPCVSVQGSLAYPNYQHDWSPTIGLFGSQCTVIKGNSGSPVIDSQGRALAVISHSNYNQTKEQTYFKHQAQATNLACSDLSSIGLHRNSNCNSSKTVKDPLPDDNQIKKIYVDSIAKIISEYPAIKFKMKFIKIAFTRDDKASLSKTAPIDKKTIELTPYCIKPESTGTWKTRQTSITSEGTFFLQSFSDRHMVIERHFDPYYRMSLSYKLEPLTVYNLKVDLNLLGREKIPGYWEATGHFAKLFGEAGKRPLTISYCTPSELANPVIIEYE